MFKSYNLYNYLVSFHLSIGKPNVFDWPYLVSSYKKLVNKTDIVLEIGASDLYKTKSLSTYCQTLIGIDLYADKLPKNFANVSYHQADWQKLTQTIKPASINLAVSSHVIEHIPNDHLALRQLYSVLQPGGLAIITTPNRFRLVRTLIETFTPPRTFPWHDHLREYSHQDLINLLDASPFDNHYQIFPVVFGVHGGSIYCYLEKPPLKCLENLSNFWQIHLTKPC